MFSLVICFFFWLVVIGPSLLKWAVPASAVLQQIWLKTCQKVSTKGLEAEICLWHVRTVRTTCSPVWNISKPIGRIAVEFCTWKHYAKRMNANANATLISFISWCKILMSDFDSTSTVRMTFVVLSQMSQQILVFWHKIRFRHEYYYIWWSSDFSSSFRSKMLMVNDQTPEQLMAFLPACTFCLAWISKC